VHWQGMWAHRFGSFSGMIFSLIHLRQGSMAPYYNVPALGEIAGFLACTLGKSILVSRYTP
jgi:hypothetical protein